MSCISEESLTQQLKDIATSMEEHRKNNNNLTTKNMSLKHENENISREIRSMYLKTNMHIISLIYHYYLYLLAVKYD